MPIEAKEVEHGEASALWEDWHLLISMSLSVGTHHCTYLAWGDWKPGVVETEVTA